MDFVECGNPDCNGRVLRKIAISSISNRLFCGRNCLNAVSKAQPFVRNFGPVSDETPLNGHRIEKIRSKNRTAERVHLGGFSR